MGLFDYYLDRLCKQNDPAGDKGRLTILRDMAEAVHKTGSAVLIDTYAQKTALRLGVSPEAVRAEFAQTRRATSGVQHSAEDETDSSPEPQIMERPSPQEFWLLKLLLLHDELAAWTALHLDLNWISHSLARRIIAARLAAQKNESWKNLAAFLDESDSPEMRSLITEAATEERKIPNPEIQLADVVLKLRNQFLDRQIAGLTQKTASPEISDAERIQLLQGQKKLREQKAAPLTALAA